MPSSKDALASANKALESAPAGSVEEAKARHSLGEAQILSEEIDCVKNGAKFGVKSFKDALAIYKERNMSAEVAAELCAIASATLKYMVKPKSVCDMAGEAFEIYKKLGKHDEAAACLELIVEAHSKYKNWQEATKAAWGGVMYFKSLNAEKEIARAWILMTEVHAAEGEDTEKGKDAITNAVDIATKLNDQALRVKVLMAKAKAECAHAINTGSYDKEEFSTLDMAMEAADNLQDNELQLSVLRCKLAVATSSKDGVKAEEAGQALLDKARQHQDNKREEAKALLALAEAAYAADENPSMEVLEAAAGRARSARSLALELNDTKVEGEALWQIVQISKRLDQDDDAAEAATDILSVLKNAPQADKTLAKASAELAQYYLEKRSLEEAVKHADAATAFAKRTEDAMCEAEVMIVNAEVYYSVAGRQEHDTRQGVNNFHKFATKAWQTAKLAKARCERFQFKELLPKALCAIGEIGVAFDADLASASAEQAQKLYEKTDDELGQATAVVLQANILYHKGQNGPAKGMAEKGLGLAREAGAQDLVADAEDLIARCAAASPAAATAALPDAAAAATPAAGAAPAAGSVAVAEKAGLDPEAVQEIVKKVALQSLSDMEEDEFHGDTALMDAGMDSLSSVAFRNQLAAELGMKMPASLMFDFPNMRLIVDMVVEESKM